MSFKEIKLPSGAILKVAPAPFADSKALYQAILEEGKGIKVNSREEFGDLVKNVFCYSFASPKIEACLWKCFEKCLYDDTKGSAAKIDKDTFEPTERRQDWTQVCFEVAMENVSPFARGLMPLYSQILASAESILG